MSYDSWKLATPPEHEDDRDERCPHGEDRPDDCEACNDPYCKDCGERVPMEDLEQGFETCASCAEIRRDVRFDATRST